MSVFGVALTQTVVVSNRATAMVVARACKTLGIRGLTIDILAELAASSKQAYTYNQSKEQPICLAQNDRSGTSTAVFVPLISCVTIVKSEVSPVIEARLRNWFLYDGSGYQVC